MKRTNTITSINNSFPQINKENEYAIFSIPEKITLHKDSEIRYKFLDNNTIPFKNIYHITHSLNRYNTRL